MHQTFSKPHWFLLVCILLLSGIAIVPRLPLLTEPFVGSHLFRQLQTLSTIEAYANQGVDLLRPRTNYMAYPGHLLLEFPLFQAIAASLSNFLKQEPLVVTRILNLLIGLLSAGVLYGIARHYYDSSAALIVAFAFLITPLNLMYHVSTLTDPTAVLAVLVATNAYLHLTKPHASFRWVWPFFAALVVSVLIKPLYLLPLALMVMAEFSTALIKEKSMWCGFAGWLNHRKAVWIPLTFALVVMIGWLNASSLLSSGQDVTSHLGWSALRNPSFYITITLRYLFYIQTPIALLFTMLGWIWLRGNTPNNRMHWWVFALLPCIYYLLFANINRPHDYYSLILVPFVALASGGGMQWLLETARTHANKVTAAIAITSFLLGSFLYLCNYWLTPNTRNRYSELAATSQGLLQPYGWSLVLVDRDGPFELNEYLGESRRDIVAGTSSQPNLDYSTKQWYAGIPCRFTNPPSSTHCSSNTEKLSGSAEISTSSGSTPESKLTREICSTSSSIWLPIPP